jgi:hypothetical protein
MNEAERLTAWNEGDTDVELPVGYGPDSLDWQRDLRAVLAAQVTKAGFRSRVRSLWNIDGWLLPELTTEQQTEFMHDPVRYFTRADKRQSDAIWREIEKRQYSHITRGRDNVALGSCANGRVAEDDGRPFGVGA